MTSRELQMKLRRQENTIMQCALRNSTAPRLAPLARVATIAADGGDGVQRSPVFRAAGKREDLRFAR